LNSAELSNLAIDREVVAFVDKLKRYRYYLEDENFLIISDDRHLHWLESHKDEISRLGRWAIELSAVSFILCPFIEEGDKD
jgi:hypothetical protein